MKGKEILRFIMLNLLSFILGISIIGTAAVFVVDGTLLSADFAAECLDGSGAAEGLLSEFDDALVDISLPSGVSAEYFTGCITEEDLSRDLKSAVRYIYGGEPVAIPRDELEGRFLSSFIKYAEDNSIEVTEDIRAALEELASETVSSYAAYAAVPAANTLRTAIAGVSGYIPAAKLLLPAFAAAAALMIVMMGRRERAFLKYIAISCLTAGVMGLIATAFIRDSLIGRIGLGSAALIGFIDELIGGAADRLGVISPALIATGVLAAAIHTGGILFNGTQRRHD